MDCKPLDSSASFLLDLEGHKVVALKLPSKIAVELSGQQALESMGIWSRLKARLGFGSDPDGEDWLTVTNVDNPLLDEHDKFEALVAQQLSDATGTSVAKTAIAISAIVPINGEEQTPSFTREESLAAPSVQAKPATATER